MGLPYGEEIMIVGRTVWTQSTSVTDRQTDGRTDGQTDRITITKTVQRRASHGKKTVNTIHWFDASCSVISVNNSITLISPVQSLAGLHFLPLTVHAVSANFPTVFSESQNASPLDAEHGPDFNAK